MISYNECIMRNITLIKATSSILLIGFMFINTKIASADVGGEKILEIGQKMIDNGEIIKGSCWDFINTAYNRAGYQSSKRETIFSSTKNNGPYADINMIKPGDWLYYINYSYNMIEHSGIFVRWVDKDKKIARILGYAGENKDLPGRYRDFDLKSVYNIIRTKGSSSSKTIQYSLKHLNGGKKCSSNLILTQNLKAPSIGKSYVRNGRYHWYTKQTVKEADILQKHLNRLGFNAGVVDGIIGPKTKSAILRLQKFLGTSVDGYVGPKTRALLNNSC